MHFVKYARIDQEVAEREARKHFLIIYIRMLTLCVLICTYKRLKGIAMKSTDLYYVLDLSNKY